MPTLPDPKRRQDSGSATPRAQTERPRSPHGWGLLALVIALCTVPALLAALKGAPYGAASFATNNSDALVFRSAAELLARGLSPYDARTLQEHIAQTRLDGRAPPYDLPFAYPPNALPMFALLLIGSPRFAFYLFLVLGTALMLLSVYGIARRFCPQRTDALVVVLGAGLSGPTVFNGYLGQTGCYLAAAVFAYALSYRTAPLRAGIALGLMAFKPQYALPLGIVALVQRRWQTVMAAAGTFLVCSLLSGVLYGFDLWTQFAGAAGSFNHTLDHMCNWFAFAYALVPESREALHGAGLPVMFLGLLALAAYCRMDRDREDAGLRGLIVATALVPLISPNTHPYDLIVWILPVCALASRRPRVPAGIVVCLFGLLILLILVTGYRWILPLIGLVLVLLVARPARRSATMPIPSAVLEGNP